MSAVAALGSRGGYERWTGRTADGNGASATRTYTGHDLDPVTGMYFAPFRYYAPGLARWTARDPIIQDNLYSYTRNSPVQGCDSLGLMTEGQCDIAQKLLACEAQYGTSYCSSHYSVSWGEDKSFGHLTTDLPFPTAYGDIDLDWFMDLTGFIPHSDYLMPNYDILYIGAKFFWRYVDDNPAHFPYSDVKERRTLSALRHGYNTYRELFPFEFMEKECYSDDAFQHNSGWFLN